MKKCLKLVFISFIVVIPFKIKGLCSVEDKMRYNSLSANVTVSYDYIENGDSVSFNITIHNVHRDLVVVDKLTNKQYQSKNSDLNNFTISGLSDGKNYSFGVRAKNGDCSTRFFNTLYVNLPKYNKYYKDQVCDGADDYLLCQKWAEIGNISYDEFKSSVESYKKSSNSKIDDEEKEEINWLYMISDFWAKYYIYILGTIIVAAGTAVIIIKKKNRYEF